MRTIDYKRADMIAQSVGCMALAGGSAWMAFVLHGELMLLCAFLATSLPFASIALAVRARGDCVALRFDDRALHVATLFGRTTVAWWQVRDVHRQVLQQSYAFGLVKQETGRYLIVTVAEGDGFERKLKLNENLLDWPRDAMPALIDDIARAAAAGPAANASRPPMPAPRAGFGRKAV